MKNLLAAITLFTRIRAWKLAELRQEHYRKAVVYWPLTGWVTGGTAAIVVYVMSFLIPLLPAVVLGIAARMFLTCALHEDGLADFCDGFGGGSDKERILAIMKDSHIGTFGVLGLSCYLLIEVSLLSSLTPLVAALAIFAADPFAKLCASQVVNRLDYARPEGAKNKILYDRMSPADYAVSIVSGIIPVIPLLLTDMRQALSLLFPIAAVIILIGYFRRRISGYTGDCCGASALICECAMIIGIVIIYFAS